MLIYQWSNWCFWTEMSFTFEQKHHPLLYNFSRKNGRQYISEMQLVQFHSKCFGLFLQRFCPHHLWVKASGKHQWQSSITKKWEFPAFRATKKSTCTSFELIKPRKNMLAERYSQVVLKLMTPVLVFDDSEPVLVLMQQTEPEIWIYTLNMVPLCVGEAAMLEQQQFLSVIWTLKRTYSLLLS